MYVRIPVQVVSPTYNGCKSPVRAKQTIERFVDHRMSSQEPKDVLAQLDGAVLIKCLRRAIESQSGARLTGARRGKDRRPPTSQKNSGGFARSPRIVPFYHFFFGWEGSPTKLDKKGNRAALV